MSDFSKAELEALQLLVQAGRVAPQARWQETIIEAGDYIIGLADRIKMERDRLVKD